MRKVITITAVAVLAVLILTEAASAYYSPAKGRFLARDPAGEEGGVNLHSFAKNAPVVLADYAGLWTIDRQGDAQAFARPDQDDTIADLAQIIGLDANEAANWLEVISVSIGGSISTNQVPSAQQKLSSCDLFKIPNSMLAYWAGNFGDSGKAWVQWRADVTTLHERGFHVVEDTGWNHNRFEDFLESKTRSKELHGVFYWGHGVYGGPPGPWWDPLLLITNPKTGWVGLTVETPKLFRDIDYTLYASWSMSYKLALGVLWGCGTDPAARPFFNDKFRGFVGVGVPHGFHLFGDTMANILPPGDQGTRR